MKLPKSIDEITEEHRKADCLNIKIDNGYRLCYRTKYNPQYFMNNLEIYDTNFKEIKEGDTISMDTNYTNYTNYLNLISQYHERQLKDIKTATALARHDCILDGELGNIAVKFADALNLATKSDRFNAVEMIPSEALTLSQKAYLSGLEVHEDVVIDELNKKCREIAALVSMCDTYEQKLDILVRYDVVKLPTKSKKTTKEK